jgi:hypothetical protein
MERFLFKKVEVWVVLLLFLAGLLGALFLAAAARHYQMGGMRLGRLGPVVDSIAAFPSTAYGAFRQGGARPGKRDLLAVEQRFPGESGFRFNYKSGARPDAGYLLLNRYDGDRARAVVELWDLDRQDRVHSWDFEGIDELWRGLDLRSSHIDVRVDRAAPRFRGTHALLSVDGSLLASDISPIVKVDLCSKLSLFKSDAIYHHSLEHDGDGNIWAAKYQEPKTVSIGRPNFVEDAIQLMDPAGKVLFQRSVVQILDENDLGHLIFGEGPAQDDPTHLNDIEPILQDGRLWARGDILLSLRHRSMVLLYRPSTNRVLWSRQGPWIHQHDVNVVGDGQISVLNNNALLLGGSDWRVRGVNNVLVQDLETGSLLSPWQAGFERNAVRTRDQGRGTVVGEEVFVEETNFGRLVQFAPDGKVAWQYVNRALDGNVYALSWSRLVPRKLGDEVRRVAAERRCT